MELEQDIGRKFLERFNSFRNIEMQQIGSNPFAYSAEAFALLRDAELCYAIKAYFASILIAHSIIEIHLRKVAKMKGTAAEIFKKAGITEEVEWLRILRNDIAHGNTNAEITYLIDEENEPIWEQYCIRAFTIMHELPVRLYRANSDG